MLVVKRMNTNEVSFNFDDYIESNFKKESKNEPIIEKEEQYYICPVCGNYNISKDRFPVCSFCKNEKPQVLNKSEIEEIKELILILKKQMNFFIKTDKKTMEIKKHLKMELYFESTSGKNMYSTIPLLVKKNITIV